MNEYYYIIHHSLLHLKLFRPKFLRVHKMKYFVSTPLAQYVNFTQMFNVAAQYIFPKSILFLKFRIVDIF